MIAIQGKLISADIFEVPFVCDIERCKGACCVEGDSGAPLENHELADIEASYPIIKSMLQSEAVDSIWEQGLYLRDSDGDMVTPLVHGHRECAYTVFEDGIAKCSFEIAFQQGKINFRKPVSCHLYPIRITRYKDYEAVNYDKWNICSPACKLGKKLNVPLYIFLKDSLIRKYGESFYDELCVAARAWMEKASDA